MITSPEIDKLVGALAKARKSFGTFSKEQSATVRSKKGDASSYSYKYGDLAGLFDATTDALSDNGIALVQAPHAHEAGGLVLVTLLAHESGQFFRSEFPLHSHEAPQELGSEITYLKRYAAGSMLGIQAEADDDGGAAQAARTANRDAGPVAAGPLRVLKVESKPTATGKSRWRVSLSDGRVATTFNLKLKTLAESMVAEECEVSAEVTSGTYGLDLNGLQRVGASMPVPSMPEPPPIDDRDIPF